MDVQFVLIKPEEYNLLTNENREILEKDMQETLIERIRVLLQVQKFNITP
jgi:Fe-S cluster biosynthesis and repair protein YggX